MIKEKPNETLIIKNVEVKKIKEKDVKKTHKTFNDKPNISDEGAEQITLDL